MLIQFMMEKFKVKEPFTQADMLRVISKKYRVHFTEIDLKLYCTSELPEKKEKT